MPSPRLVGRSGLLRTARAGPGGRSRRPAHRPERHRQVVGARRGRRRRPVRAARPCCASAGSRPSAGSRAPHVGDLVDQVPAGLSRRCRPADLAAAAGRRGDQPRDPAAGGRAWCTLLRAWAGQTLCCCWSTTRSGSTPPRPTSSGSPSGGSPARGPRRRRGRWAAEPRTIPVLPSPSTRLEVPALSADELAALLDLHGLPARTASKIHLDSAGNPFLALALAGRSSTTARRAIAQNRCLRAFLD